MAQVLARKWRPKSFYELVGQEHVSQALSYALNQQRLHHAYLFTGTRGVGKTTIARILAKSINCLEKGISAEPCGHCEHCQEIDAGRFPDLIEIDAASRTGVDDTREILDNVPYAPSKGRFKVYLIDEVHMFSRSSFNALLKTLEEPPSHVLFILATTDPQKIPATVLSRCLQFHLKNMRPEALLKHLQRVAQAEALPHEEEALRLIAQAAQGSMRDALSLLEQLCLLGQGRLNAAAASQLLGLVPSLQWQSLLQHLANYEAAALRGLLLQWDEYSPDYGQLLRQLLESLQQITVLQLQAARPEEDFSPWLQDLAAQLPVELVQLWYQILSDTWQSMPHQPDERLCFEMGLLRMLALRPIMATQDVQQLSPIREASPPPAPPQPPVTPTDEALPVAMDAGEAFRRHPQTQAALKLLDAEIETIQILEERENV